MYNTLIGLGRYEDACDLFYERIDNVTLYRLSASRQRAELLEMLFPDGVDQLPRLSKPDRQVFTLNALAAAYHFSGQPGHAAPLLRRYIAISESRKDPRETSTGLNNLSNSLQLAGVLCESEAAARRALVTAREQDLPFWEAVSLRYFGTALAARGVVKESELALQRSLRMFVAQSALHSEGATNTYLAQRALWLSNLTASLLFSEQGREQTTQILTTQIQTERMQGTAELGLNDFIKADERLHHALTRARAVNFAEEELQALVALAELRRRQGNSQVARELLDDVWEPAERGPYPLFHADASNVLAQIERDAGNPVAAIEAATQAYHLAWCDGPPFAYHWGLEAARKHLAELGAPEPSLPPFDESKYEPMPEVEIDPEDEFHVGAGGSDSD